ncbi:hypothetical protein vseg_011622 [Gypsophila vaccaria]
MVEVIVDGSLLETVAFKDENNDLMQIKVEYERKPITCAKCNQLGHHTEHCRKGQAPNKRLWQLRRFGDRWSNQWCNRWWKLKVLKNMR